MKIIKSWLGSLVLMIIGIASCVRILGQYNILNKAKITNAEILKKIEKYQENNDNWKMKIQNASDSAFLDQQVRNRLGVGAINDVWINEANIPEMDLYPKMEIVEVKNNWQKWINLFTR
jgi:hypothetical protein